MCIRDRHGRVDLTLFESGAHLSYGLAENGLSGDVSLGGPSRLACCVGRAHLRPALRGPEETLGRGVSPGRAGASKKLRSAPGRSLGLCLSFRLTLGFGLLGGGLLLLRSWLLGAEHTLARGRTARLSSQNRATARGAARGRFLALFASHMLGLGTSFSAWRLWSGRLLLGWGWRFWCLCLGRRRFGGRWFGPVSYTHLTLPTIYSV